jgi:hypothetical protein
MGYLRPCDYGVFAHQCNQNWLTRTLSFYDLNKQKGQNALTLYTKRGEELRDRLLHQNSRACPFVTSFLRLAYLPN